MASIPGEHPDLTYYYPANGAEIAHTVLAVPKNAQSTELCYTVPNPLKQKQALENLKEEQFERNLKRLLEAELGYTSPAKKPRTDEQRPALTTMLPTHSQLVRGMQPSASTTVHRPIANLQPAPLQAPQRPSVPTTPNQTGSPGVSSAVHPSPARFPAWNTTLPPHQTKHYIDDLQTPAASLERAHTNMVQHHQPQSHPAPTVPARSPQTLLQQWQNPGILHQQNQPSPRPPQPSAIQSNSDGSSRFNVPRAQHAPQQTPQQDPQQSPYPSTIAAVPQAPRADTSANLVAREHLRMPPQFSQGPSSTPTTDYVRWKQLQRWEADLLQKQSEMLQKRKDSNIAQNFQAPSTPPVHQAGPSRRAQDVTPPEHQAGPSRRAQDLTPAGSHSQYLTPAGSRNSNSSGSGSGFGSRQTSFAHVSPMVDTAMEFVRRLSQSSQQTPLSGPPTLPPNPYAAPSTQPRPSIVEQSQTPSNTVTSAKEKDPAGQDVVKNDSHSQQDMLQMPPAHYSVPRRQGFQVGKYAEREPTDDRIRLVKAIKALPVNPPRVGHRQPKRQFLKSFEFEGQRYFNKGNGYLIKGTGLRDWIGNPKLFDDRMWDYLKGWRKDVQAFYYPKDQTGPGEGAY